MERGTPRLHLCHCLLFGLQCAKIDSNEHGLVCGRELGLDLVQVWSCCGKISVLRVNQEEFSLCRSYKNPELAAFQRVRFEWAWPAWDATGIDDPQTMGHANGHWFLGKWKSDNKSATVGEIVDCRWCCSILKKNLIFSLGKIFIALNSQKCTLFVALIIVDRVPQLCLHPPSNLRFHNEFTTG